MFSRTRWFACAGVVVLSLISAAAWAEKVTLKGGTVIEGTVMQVGDKYWIKSADGKTRTVASSEVASIGAAGATAAPATDAGKTPAAGAGTTAAGTATPAPVSGSAFELAQRRVQN